MIAIATKKELLEKAYANWDKANAVFDKAITMPEDS